MLRNFALFLVSFLFCAPTFGQWAFSDSVQLNIPTTAGMRTGVLSFIKPNLTGNQKLQTLMIVATPGLMASKVRTQILNNDVNQSALQGKFGIALIRLTSGPDTLFSTITNLTLFRDSLQSALNRLAFRSSKPELVNVPLMPVGISFSARFAMAVASAMPSKTTSLASVRAYRLDVISGVSLSAIPHLVQTGEVSGPDVKNNVAVFFSSTIRQLVLGRRASGELIHQVVEMNASQSTFKKKSMDYLRDFAVRSIAKRVPANSDPSAGPVALTNIAESSGYLGNSTSFNNFNGSNYTTGPFGGGLVAAQSFWFFDADHANFWKVYHTSPLNSISIDPPPSSVAPYCTGERPSAVSASFSFNPGIVFQPDNVFRIEVSDITGNFDHPRYVARYSGTYRSSSLTDTLNDAQMPDNFQFMTSVPTNSAKRYRIRLVSSNPYLESQNSGEISNFNFCPNRPTRLWFSTARPFKPFYFRGDSIELTCYKTSTTTANNSTLRVLLSDSISSFFSGTTNLASFPANFVGDSLIIKFVIPTNIPFGLKYRIEPELDGPVSQNWRFTASVGHEISIIERNDGTVANAGPDQSVCAETANLAGNNPAVGGSGTWTRVSGTAVIANPNQPNTLVSNLSSGVNRFIWTLSVNNQITIDTVTLIRFLTPTTANAGTNQIVCINTTNLNANVPVVGIGNWSVVSGAATFSNASNANTSVTNLQVGTNVLRWTVSNGACPASTNDVEILFNQVERARAGLDFLSCITSNSVQLNGNDPSPGSTVAWSVVSGSATISNGTNPSASAANLAVGPNAFQYAISTPNCPVSADTVVVTVRDLPTTSNAGTNQNVCGNSTTLQGNLPQVGTGSWLLRSGSATIADETNPNSALLDLIPGSVVLRWVITNNPCPSSNSEVTINVTTSTVLAEAGPDTLVCGSSGRLRATIPTIGSGSWQLISGSGVIAEPNNVVTTVSNLGLGVNQFSWRVVDGACSATDVLAVTRPGNPLNLGVDTVVCNGSVYMLDAGSGYSSYLWSSGAITQEVSIDSSMRGLVWVQVVTDQGCTFSDSVQVGFAPCTEVNELYTSKGNLLIYPNPANDVVTISLFITSLADIHFDLQSISGAMVESKIWKPNSRLMMQKLSVKNLPKGVYIARIKTTDRVYVAKLIVK